MKGKYAFLITIIAVAFLCLYAVPRQNLTVRVKINEQKKNSKNKKSQRERKCPGMTHMHVPENSQISENFNPYIIQPKQLAVIQGTGSISLDPIKPVTYFDNDPSGAPIDGDPSSISQLFTFAFNKSSPECCDDSSGLTTSKGCVCLTKKQKQWFSTRGNNNLPQTCYGQSEI